MRNFGVLYSVEDVLRVGLTRDDLTSYIHSWDAVIAGLSHVLGETTLSDIFLRDLGMSPKMRHHLEISNEPRTVLRNTRTIGSYSQ